MDASYSFDEIGLKAIVEKHWIYHRACTHWLWRVERAGEDLMQFEVAPIFQDIHGGSEDGLKVWSAFSMHLSDLFAEPDVEVTQFGFLSYCVECTPVPFVGVQGKYKDRPFLLKIFLEPIPNSKPVEVIDTIKNETRTASGW